MADSNFERTRKRLRWAKKIWIAMGLIGRDSERGSMRQLVEFYRSNQWQSKGVFGDLSNDVLRVVNKIFPIANRQQAGIAARNPRVQYFPRREQDKARAPHAEALHNYDIREQNHIADLNAALRFAQFAPFPMVMRHGYTPEREILDEKGKLISFQPRAHRSRPWVEAVAPWDVLIDPRAKSFERNGGALWCAFRNIMTVDQIRRNPEMIAREKLKGFRGNVSGPWQEMVPQELLAKEDPDRSGYVEVWTIYDLEDRSWAQLTLDGIDNWLRQPADWPIPWEWLPLNAIATNPQIDTPFPKSLLEDLIPLQLELNQVRTMMSVLTRQTRRIGLFDQNKVADTTLLKDAALFEWFGVNGNPSEAIFHTQVGGLPQELLLYASQIVDDMRESVGLSLFARARRENVESATEAAAITAGQDVIEARTQDAFDRFVREVEQTYMQGRRAVLASTGGEETLRVLGPEGAASLEEFITIDAETIAGEFEFEVEAGSTRPRDRDREAQLAAIDMQVAGAVRFAKLDQFFRRWLEARHLDPARFMEAQSALASSTERGASLLRESGVEPQGATPVDANVLSLIAGGAGQ